MGNGRLLNLAAVALALLACAPQGTASGLKGKSASEQPARKNSALFGDVRFMHTGAKVGGSPSVGSVTTREGLGENVPYPGSEFLGIGYDAIFGNPTGNGKSVLDPGFRAPVLRFGYCQSDKCITRDMVHLRPMESNWASNPSFWPMAWARPEASCERSKKARTHFSSSDYAKSLSVDAEVNAEGGFFGASAAFSASAALDKFRRDVENAGSEQFSVKSYCILYSLGFAQYREGLHSMWDPVMKARLDKLPSPCTRSWACPHCAGNGRNCYTTSQWKEWEEFFRTFGTHYVYDVKLGGKFVVDITLKEKSRSSEESEETKAAIEASFDGFGASASAQLNTASSSTSQNSLAQKSKEVSVSVLGGTPPENAEDIMSSEAFGEWAATVADNPMPVQYKVAPISTSHKFKTAAQVYAAKHGGALPKSSGIFRPYRSPTDILRPGEKLFPTQRLQSPNKAASMTLTEGGEVQVFRGSKLVWKSHSKCAGEFCSVDAYAMVANDCSLRVYEDGHQRYKSTSGWCTAPQGIVIGNDGLLASYDTKGTRKFNSGTHSGNVYTQHWARNGWGN